MLEAPQDYPEYGIQEGDVMGACPSIGVIYLPPFSGAALAEMLWPEDWSLLPPG